MDMQLQCSETLTAIFGIKSCAVKACDFVVLKKKTICGSKGGKNYLCKPINSTKDNCLRYFGFLP